MNKAEAMRIVEDAISGRPNTCMSEHYRGLKEVYDFLFALYEISEAPASAVVADAPRPPPTPRLKSYLVSLTLQGSFLATDSDEAWDMAMDRIAGRTGLDLVDHTIVEPEDDGL